jgi:hypothetical protein
LTHGGPFWLFQIFLSEAKRLNSANIGSRVNPPNAKKFLAAVVGWAWTIVAGGGGLGLLILEGPWPPTNGWFALGSGLSACPLTAWLLRRYTGFAASGFVRFAAAALFIIAGRTALAIEGQASFLPHPRITPADHWTCPIPVREVCWLLR